MHESGGTTWKASPGENHQPPPEHQHPSHYENLTWKLSGDRETRNPGSEKCHGQMPNWVSYRSPTQHQNGYRDANIFLTQSVVKGLQICSLYLKSVACVKSQVTVNIWYISSLFLQCISYSVWMHMKLASNPKKKQRVTFNENLKLPNLYKMYIIHMSMSFDWCYFGLCLTLSEHNPWRVHE